MQGWWTYQLCFKAAVRQLHLENKKVTLRHELGLFDNLLTDVEMVKGPKLLEPEDLLPGMTEQLPYIKHMYTSRFPWPLHSIFLNMPGHIAHQSMGLADGSPCEEDSALLRQAELRIACSANRCAC